VLYEDTFTGSTRHALHAEIRQEDDPETTAHRWIVVHRVGDGVNKLDDELGHEVAGCGFAAENEGARGT
jgi:hypothetical protein